MITFLPNPSFLETAKILDKNRLGKQRLECLQILQILCGEKPVYQSHPAVNMWRGAESSLLDYMSKIVDRWKFYGYEDNCMAKALELHTKYWLSVFSKSKPPTWSGNSALYASHRSNLIRKDPNFYSQYNWCESYDLPYVWPSNVAATDKKQYSLMVTWTKDGKLEII